MMRKIKDRIKLSFFENGFVYSSIKLFLFASFFCGCSNSKPLQTDVLIGFFEDLLLEHGGAFTLFGTKPITIEDLCDSSEKSLDEISQYLAQHPEIEVVYMDRKLDEGWKAYKNLYGQMFFDNYILTEIDSEDSRVLLFVNIPESITILNRYRKDFVSVIGREFNPETLIQDLREKKHDNWRKILSHSKTLGILAGYGYLNSHRFSEIRNISHNFLPSEDNDPRYYAECFLNNKPFRIPIFVMIDELESSLLVSEYKKQRDSILKIYEGKDFLQTTFHQLQKKRLKI